MTTPPHGSAEDPMSDIRADDAPPGEPGVTLERLLGEIRKLQTSFDAKIRYDESRERSIQSMSDEIAAYRENRAQLQLRPLLMDLITLYDDLTRVGGASDCAPGTAKILGEFRDAVEQTLARYGVEPFTTAGEAVDRSRQRVISVLAGDEPSHDRKIAQRLRPGFQWHDQVLRPEWVNVYRYTAPSSSAEPKPLSPAELAEPSALPTTPVEPSVPSAPSAVPEADEGALH
ncbi:hypothetical protein Vqi01_21620 [Micromonospora qiuiae]|uniref:Nucleotide exchange factor GrpE n=1 Tax=Micromonospora qiuiae TaxID=502268 RepID=A0ABQ4JA12_9ACTN|nr:nucleotide exchange factor GrpE [Micromonospora qiuiae]GIJ27000.1 hypothetical protein Vqi01_21620 [Micromonospora qiuiae]